MAGKIGYEGIPEFKYDSNLDHNSKTWILSRLNQISDVTDLDLASMAFMVVTYLHGVDFYNNNAKSLGYPLIIPN